MTGEIMKTPGETPIILKNMKQYLKDPKTIKELYTALNTLPREEFYDLRPEELREVHHIYMDLTKIFDRESNSDHMRYEISQMLHLKDEVEKMEGILVNALMNYPMDSDGLFTKKEQEKQKEYDMQLRTIFANAISYFQKYKKQLTIDDIYQMNVKIKERLNMINKVEDSVLAYLITLLLQKHIYTGKDILEKALQHLMEIHSEDINRPLLDSLTLDYQWDSLLFMRYGFGQITVEELKEGIETIIKRNKEDMNRLIEPAIPLYHWLRGVVEKINNEKDEDTQIVPFEVQDDDDDDEEGIQKIPKDIKIKEINDYLYQNESLRTILKTGNIILELKLKPLKDLCDLSKGENKILKE